MISGPITLTIETVPYSLVKINQDNQGSKFFARSTDGTKRVTLVITHSYPSSGSDKDEVHFARVDLETYDAEGVFLRNTAVWFVFKTVKGAVQDTAELASVYESLTTALAASTNALRDQILNREP